MKFYLVMSESKGQVSAGAELKFFEWFKHLKKRNQIIDYWALREKPGLAAILRLNFESELEEVINGWNQRVPSEFAIEPLKDPRSLEVELAKRALG